MTRRPVHLVSHPPSGKLETHQGRSALRCDALVSFIETQKVSVI